VDQVAFVRTSEITGQETAFQVNKRPRRAALEEKEGNSIARRHFILPLPQQQGCSWGNSQVVVSLSGEKETGRTRPMSGFLRCCPSVTNLLTGVLLLYPDRNHG
jgi:hypothetical protein